MPDHVFQGAESLAKRMKRSRSRKFSDALRARIASRSPEKLTRQMNVALAEIGDSNLKFTKSAAQRILQRSDW